MNYMPSLMVAVKEKLQEHKINTAASSYCESFGDPLSFKLSSLLLLKECPAG